MYVEDVDLCTRLGRAGWEVLFSPELEVLHIGGVSTGGYRSRRMVVEHSRSIYKRSEEHTSELQSQSNLVCRLLLEKKNNHMLRDIEYITNHLPISLDRKTRCTNPLPNSPRLAFIAAISGSHVVKMSTHIYHTLSQR